MRYYLLLLFAALSFGLFAQGLEVPKVTFVLENAHGHHRMFRVEGPGVAYGFTMNRRESLPCLWPVGSQLHYSSDGYDTTGLILTITKADEGRTLATTGRPLTAEPSATVRFRLRNPGLGLRRVALISYRPDKRGNGTQIFRLFPLASKAFDFPVGTKLYLADADQVDTVMSGQRIDGDPPFIVVTAGLDGRTVAIK